MPNSEDLKGVKKVGASIKLYFYYISYNVGIMTYMSLELLKVDKLDKK